MSEIYFQLVHYQGMNSMRLWGRNVETSGTLLAMKSLVTNQIENRNDLSLVSAGNITLVADNGGRKTSMIKMYLWM